MLGFCQPFYIRLQSVRIAIYGRGGIRLTPHRRGQRVVNPERHCEGKDRYNLNIAEVGGDVGFPS
jgi:hypothetical protein